MYPIRHESIEKKEKTEWERKRGREREKEKKRLKMLTQNELWKRHKNKYRQMAIKLCTENKDPILLVIHLIVSLFVFVCMC